MIADVSIAFSGVVASSVLITKRRSHYMISRKGNIKKDLAIMFNHGDIGEIVCRGYEDDERRFRSLFLNTGA